MESIAKWKAHSDRQEFVQEFEAITLQYSYDNDMRTTKIEEFLLTEAQKAGVVNIVTNKIQKNSNRWAKHMAPWFDTSCKEARSKYRKLKRELGKKHGDVRQAYQ